MLEVEGGEEETGGTGEIKHYELCERRRKEKGERGVGG